jgi:hypothetical protein
MQVVVSRNELVATVTITGATPSGPIVVGWGDGSAQAALVADATGAVSDPHSYATPGSYAITVTDMTTTERRLTVLQVLQASASYAAAVAAGFWAGSYAYP